MPIPSACFSSFLIETGKPARGGMAVARTPSGSVIEGNAAEGFVGRFKLRDTTRVDKKVDSKKMRRMLVCCAVRV